MSHTPRLIVLDLKFSTDALQDFATRVAQGLRWQTEPLVLMPGKDHAAPGASFQDPSKVDRQQWINAETSIRNALRAGRDVVVCGPVEACMGKDWIEKLAQEGNARSAGWRLLLSTSNMAPSPAPSTDDWTNVDWSAIDADGASARSIAMQAEQLLPGTQVKPASNRITLLQMQDGKERSAVLESAIAQAGEHAPLVIDLEARRAEIRNRTAIRQQSESAHKETRITRSLWRDAEPELRKAAREGRNIIIASDKLSDTPAREAAKHAGFISGAKPFAVRVDLKPGRPDADGDARRFDWPLGGALQEKADGLARELLGGQAEPSLEDLLDAPFADRKRPVPTP